MKQIFFIISLSVTLFLLQSCRYYHDTKNLTISKKSSISISNDDVTINELKVVSSPGHSFVPLYLTNDNCNDQAAADFADLVLKVISRFEKDNPNLKITSWKLQNGYKCEIVGIWIDHEMRYSITDSMNHKPQDQK